MGTKRIMIVILLLLLGIFAGCSNDADPGPTLPGGDGPAGGGFEGDQDETPIPIPYAEVRSALICDMEWEHDGDLFVSTGSTTFLFTPYGLMKRDDFPDPCVDGIANNSTGRGSSFYGRSSLCNPSGWSDDIYVDGGHFTTSFAGGWFAGVADFNPFDGCTETNTTMGWVCNDDPPPNGYVYHPFTGRTYIQHNPNDTITGDTYDVEECGGEWVDGLTHTFQISEACGGPPVLAVILSYDQAAPFLDGMWTGFPDEPMDPGGDWCAYTDFSTFDCFNNPMFGLWTLGTGYLRMANTLRVLSVNGTGDGPFDPSFAPPSGLPPARDGLSVANVSDFAMDYQGRMIISFANSDAYCISKPVRDGEHIIIDKVIGGRMNGMGTGPGEFQGPNGVAINQMTQEHIICDSGNDRVQIFTSQGDFVRQFRTGENPRMALVDLFGNLIVATDTGMEMYNEQGSLPVFGSIEGFVTDKETGLAIESADVFIMSTFDLPVQGGFTTEDGYFSISTVPAGTHTLVVSKVSFIDTSATVSVVAGERTEVHFYIERIPVTTPGKGNVTGTIIKDGSPQTGGGQGIAGLAVGVVGLGVSDITNGNGEFMLFGVDTGPQKIQFSSNGQIVYEKNIHVPDGQTLDIGITYLKFP